jgi:hypothetical protein
MDSTDRRSHGGRQIGLVVGMAVLAAVLLRPATAQVGSTETRYFSCPASAWESGFTDTDYSTSGSLRFRTGGQYGLFRCNVALPHAARIRAVHFSVHDADPLNNVTCELWRTNMTTSIGVETFMATTSTDGTPGSTRIGTAAINQPAVNNRDFSYFVQCIEIGEDNSLGIYGTTIRYTVGSTTTAVAAPRTSTGSSTAR